MVVIFSSEQNSNYYISFAVQMREIAQTNTQLLLESIFMRAELAELAALDRESEENPENGANVANAENAENAKNAGSQ